MLKSLKSSVTKTLALATTLLLLGCAPTVKGNDADSLALRPKFHLDAGFDQRLTDNELRQVLDLNDSIDCARDPKKCPKPQ